MRILTIAHSYPLHSGDATAPFMASIIEGLAARGHSLDVVLPEHPHFRQEDTRGIRFLRYRYSPVAGWAPWGYGRALTADSRINRQVALAVPAVLIALRRRVLELLSTQHYDVVHSHWLVPNGWAALSPAARRGVPLVVSLHGSDMAIAERMWPIRPVWRRVLTRISALTAPSNDLCRRAEQLGADPTTASTIHYGVDTAQFAPRQVGTNVRASLGAAADSLLVVCVGRLVEKKGFRYLIEACSRLERVHLAVVGEGELDRQLAGLASRTGASVTFTGELDRAGVADAIAAADVFAVPSVVDEFGNVDGLPNTLLEALATGRPIVASTVAGIPEVIEDGVNGLLVPEKDVDALQRALRSLQNQPELRDRLRHEARKRAVRELSWDAAAESFERVLSRAKSSR